MIESPSKSLFHCKQTNIHIDIQCIKRKTFDNHECLLNVRRTGVGWMRLLDGLWQGVLAECIARGPVYTGGYGCGRSGKHRYPAPPTTVSCPGEIRGLHACWPAFSYDDRYRNTIRFCSGGVTSTKPARRKTSGNPIKLYEVESAGSDEPQDLFDQQDKLAAEEETAVVEFDQGIKRVDVLHSPDLDSILEALQSERNALFIAVAPRGEGVKFAADVVMHDRVLRRYGELPDRRRVDMDLCFAAVNEVLQFFYLQPR